MDRRLNEHSIKYSSSHQFCESKQSESILKNRSKINQNNEIDQTYKTNEIDEEIVGRTIRRY